jgi:hypothetical protein
VGFDGVESNSVDGEVLNEQFTVLPRPPVPVLASESDLFPVALPEINGGLKYFSAGAPDAQELFGFTEGRSVYGFAFRAARTKQGHLVHFIRIEAKGFARGLAHEEILVRVNCNPNPYAESSNFGENRG